nr:helix-turn-helix transcriptional regulator [Actinomyces sp.]
MTKHVAPQVAVTRAARALMTERGWSQRDLAQALGMSVQTLSHRLNGYRRWTLDDVEALALLGARLPAFGEVAS